MRILAHSVVPNDAVGNDVVQMAALLSAAGYGTHVYAAGIHPAYAESVHRFSASEARQWSGERDIVIYHHSTSWPEGEEYLETANAPVVIRYHNVTPPEFFAGFSEPHFTASMKGQDATRRLAGLPDAVFWGVSQFNCAELIEYGVPRQRCRVLAPLHYVEELAEQAFDHQLASNLWGHGARLLFVGGFKPNKGHERAIHVFSRYHHEVNPKSQLIFAGAISELFTGYAESLRRYAAELGVQKSVLFYESVNASALRTLYTSATAFLCLSAHEGFCVPLIEAMYFRVPIVAWGTTAVPETVGACGIVWEDFAEELFIESLDTLAENTGVAIQFRSMGRKRYDSIYALETLKLRLLAMMSEADQVMN